MHDLCVGHMMNVPVQRKPLTFAIFANNFLTCPRFVITLCLLYEYVIQLLTQVIQRYVAYFILLKCISLRYATLDTSNGPQ